MCLDSLSLSLSRRQKIKRKGVEKALLIPSERLTIGFQTSRHQGFGHAVPSSERDPVVRRGGCRTGFAWAPSVAPGARWARQASCGVLVMHAGIAGRTRGSRRWTRQRNRSRQVLSTDFRRDPLEYSLGLKIAKTIWVLRLCIHDINELCGMPIHELHVLVLYVSQRRPCWCSSQNSCNNCRLKCNTTYFATE